MGVETPRVPNATSSDETGRFAAAPRLETEFAPQATQTPTSPLASTMPHPLLAELGIDPTGMSANDLLLQYYARRGQTSNKLMNAYAEQRNIIRAQTPRSFDGVFTSQAHHELRHARNAGNTGEAVDVHQVLDRWGVDALADVCRSVRYFDEEQKGYTTEYMRHFSKRTYGKMP